MPRFMVDGHPMSEEAFYAMKARLEADGITVAEPAAKPAKKAPQPVKKKLGGKAVTSKSIAVALGSEADTNADAETDIGGKYDAAAEQAEADALAAIEKARVELAELEREDEDGIGAELGGES